MQVGLGNYYYTSGTFYQKSQSIGLATDKFHRSPGAAIRKNDLASLDSQYASVGSSIFTETASASEQASVLVAQQYQARVQDEAKASQSSTLDVFA
jgi:hypothetical protein